MSIYFRWLVDKSMMSLISLLMLPATVFGSAADAAQFPLTHTIPAVVVDPGHGGHDSGVQGPTGTLEKTVALQFAQILQEKLKDRYRVTSTRTTDYALNYIERANLANHAKADLFISIHTGGGFRRTGSGSTIFYFTPFSDQGSDQPGNQSTENMADNPSANLRWHELQVSHIESSRRLARTLQQHLAPPEISMVCKVYSAPLLLLEGLNMPAILFEIGYLSNPTEEKKLRDPEFLGRMADRFSQGIDTFFQNVER